MTLWRGPSSWVILRMNGGNPGPSYSPSETIRVRIGARKGCRAFSTVAVVVPAIHRGRRLGAAVFGVAQGLAAGTVGDGVGVREFSPGVACRAGAGGAGGRPLGACRTLHRLLCCGDRRPAVDHGQLDPAAGDHRHGPGHLGFPSTYLDAGDGGQLPASAESRARI